MGLEPTTSAVTGQHSNQLNYHSILKSYVILDLYYQYYITFLNLVAGVGFEPTTYGL